VNFLQRQLENPVRFARIKGLFYAILVVTALAEITLPMVFQADHLHFSFEGLPAWGSLYGLVSCVVIIIVSKILGKRWLMRREDYYDD
tara:strand:+ start:952 stop:1215 length:264 start_codon:yes stop_codon:yes gene_type:complete